MGAAVIARTHLPSGGDLSLHAVNVIQLSFEVCCAVGRCASCPNGMEALYWRSLGVYVVMML
ncbi:hypothetical protein GCM10009412_34570 [Aeromonas salmonicida subsp. achromogenes]